MAGSGIPQLPSENAANFLKQLRAYVQTRDPTQATEIGRAHV